MPPKCAFLMAALALASLGSVFAGDAAPSCFFIDLAPYANMGFKDDQAGDGQGGWSDQGSENDFKDFDWQAESFCGVPFKIVDPAVNCGKAVMVFSSPHIDSKVSLKKAEFKFSGKGPQARFLYLLHTASWAPSKSVPVGEISVKFKDGKAVKLDVLCLRDVADWWRAEARPNAAVACEKETKESSKGVYLSKFELSSSPKELESLTLATAGDAIWLVIGATLGAQDFPLPKTDSWTATAGRSWKKVDASSLAVEPGSCLDLGEMVEEGPAGRYGRVTVNSEGKFAFEKRPSQAVKFFGCSIQGLGFKDKEGIESFAKAVRRQGYNLVRFHFLDHILMKDSKSEASFNPEELDKFQYLFHCLKGQGVYTYLDAVTSWSAYTVGSGWRSKVSYKGKMYVDEKVRAHWRSAVGKLLGMENPYTKTKLADDPAVAMVLCYNEQEVITSKLRFPEEEAAKAWQNWLLAKYGSFDALKKAWGSSIGAASSLGQLPFSLKEISKDGACGTDTALFAKHLETELWKWYARSLREMGYGGVVTQFDWRKELGAYPARALVPAVSMHTYHTEPSDYIRKNSSMRQASSLQDAAAYWRLAAGTRYEGKPFFITEYGHVFWNKFRFEEGLVMGAYSSLQGYDGLMAHATPVMLRMPDSIYPFGIAADPVGRASQILAAHLFFRGDAAPSAHTVELKLSESDVLRGGVALRKVDPEQTKLALLSRFAVSCGPSRGSQPDASCSLGGPLEIRGQKRSGGESGFSLAAAVDSLKAARILGKGNLTDPQAQIYQSDTGQTVLDAAKRELRVLTPRCEAVSFVSPGRFQLDALSIDESSTPGCIAAVSRSAEALSDSRRILLIYSTNALNSGMSFTSAKQLTLLSRGKAPVLLEAGSAKLRLRNKHAGSMRAWALGLDGSRKEQIELVRAPGELALSLDTGAPASGATPFFELSAD